MGSLIGQRTDYNGVGALRGQQLIPSTNLPKYAPAPSPPPGEKCLVLQLTQIKGTFSVKN